MNDHLEKIGAICDSQARMVDLTLDAYIALTNAIDKILGQVDDEARRILHDALVESAMMLNLASS